MIPWHPHTETPAEPGTVAIIAVMLSDPRSDPCLKEGLWRWINSQWVPEDANYPDPLPEAACGERYWWCRETDLIAALAAQYPTETTPA